ncbi:uncharacterized protein CLUP02_07623 [Colletotrichum lupini]|uniref:Uncharacterized protein n=1 Tax=Colletotrichum lupini TaxID=145971 RepID=A0A9Q8SRC2_9PEZI|nr:uncharacterized protein CLUP02_07623 [Colletotrichum lupini]UQC82137.1 hypothetical protein CLUP02_07623 [Colletotrichum lupini]
MAYDAVRPSPFHVLDPNGCPSNRVPPALLDSNWTGSRIRFQQFRPVVVHDFWCPETSSRASWIEEGGVIWHPVPKTIQYRQHGSLANI